MRWLSLLLLYVLVFTGPSLAAPKNYLYNYGEEAGDKSLPKEDEVASPEIGLRAPIVFFGQVYNTIFVSTYGI